MTHDKITEMRKARCLKSYYHFFKEFWQEIEPEQFADNFHIKYLCDEVQEVAERVFLKHDESGKSYRDKLEYNLVINISPGETKSSITTIFFPVWAWLRDPTLRVLTLSYSASLSMLHSMKSRDIIESPRFQEWYGDRFQLRKDQSAKGEYGIMYGPGFTEVGGVRSASSVGGSITGKHFHIIIGDDVINPQQAQSDAERETANDFMGSTLNSRKVDEKITPTMLVMQRLHEEDPTATLARKWKKSGLLKWIRLPADDRYLISPPEMSERYTQDGNLRVMNPLRKPAAVIATKEAEHTPEDFSGQFGQDPTPAEGNILKKAWFKQRFHIAEAEQDLVWNATFDGAYTEAKKNSASAVLIWSVRKGKLYLRDYREWWLEFPDLVSQLPELLFENGFTRQSVLFVEPKGPGKSLVQVIRNDGRLNVVEDPLPVGITTMEGKVLRVHRSAPYVFGMNLFLSSDVDWGRFIHQCVTFPRSTHTDMVDTLTMAVEKVEQYAAFSDPAMWGTKLS